MSFFRRKKKEVVKRTPVQNMNRELVIRRHKSRVENLHEELKNLGRELETLELDTEIPKGTKSKQSDLTIKRMVLIEYELGIRENLLQWL